jgi:nitrogen fixation protein FixH
VNTNPHKEPMRSLIDLIAEAGWTTSTRVDDDGVDIELTEDGLVKLSMLDVLFELSRPLTEDEQKCLAALVKEHGLSRP